MAGNSGAIRRSDMYNDPDFNYAHFGGAAATNTEPR